MFRASRWGLSCPKLMHQVDNNQAIAKGRIWKCFAASRFRNRTCVNNATSCTNRDVKFFLPTPESDWLASWKNFWQKVYFIKERSITLDATSFQTFFYCSKYIMHLLPRHPVCNVQRETKVLSSRIFGLLYTHESSYYKCNKSINKSSQVRKLGKAWKMVGDAHSKSNAR